MKRSWSTCSRCGCSSANPECYVCEDDAPLPLILDEEDQDDWLDNLLDTEEE